MKSKQSCETQRRRIIFIFLCWVAHLTDCYCFISSSGSCLHWYFTYKTVLFHMVKGVFYYASFPKMLDGKNPNKQCCFHPNNVHSRNGFPFSLYKTSWVILENIDLVISCKKKKKTGKGKTTEMNNTANPAWISFCIFIYEIALWAIVNRLLMCQELSLRYLAALPRPAPTPLSNHTRIPRPCALCVDESRDFRVTCSGSREGWAYSLEEL